MLHTPKQKLTDTVCIKESTIPTPESSLRAANVAHNTKTTLKLANIPTVVNLMGGNWGTKLILSNG